MKKKSEKRKVPIIPRGKYVLVKPDEEQSRRSGDLFIPSSVEQEKKSVGTVLGFGKEVKDIGILDRVIFGTYAGDTIKHGDTEYKILDEADILAFLNE